MGIFDRLKKKPEPERSVPENKSFKNKEDVNKTPLTDEERDLLAKIESDLSHAKTTREAECEYLGNSIEDLWEDDYLLYKGGGLQWMTNITNPSKRTRQNRPNSEDNFIFSALTVQHANVTRDTPDVLIVPMEDSDEKIAKELTCISKYNDEKNEFPKLWDKWVMDFITSGPTIAMVTWDNEWIGGKGPDKWVGDVRLTRCSKWDMYFDPAITDLETSESLQQCSYIIRRPRKKLKFIKDTWGKDVSDELNEDELINEGNNPEQAYLVEYWHRGFPHYVDDKSAGMFRDKALELESTNEYYKAQDYYDRAKGNLNGIHVAYYANGVLLEYVPYVYEHGLYPFVFTTRFDDEKNPWGFSEIRNLKIPQIAHNKADEIEMEAMSRQGLGGYFYTKGAISPKQRDKIVESNGKGGMMFEVDNAALLQARQGVSVPASIPNYKEHKMRMINQISGNTDIMQGQSPGAGVPFASLQQLGARADVRMGAITGKLEGFLKGINKLRIELFTEFYTEERYYRLKNIDGTKEKVPFTRDTFMKEYQYETGITDTGESIPMLEKFTPELDISVRILSEKPTDRGYYTNLAFQLYQLQLIDYEDLLKTLDEGKLPSIELLIQKLKDKAQQAQLQQMIQQPPQGPPLM